MTKFRFVGNGDSDPQHITLYGVTFKLGGPAQDVQDADAARRLSGNSHFEAAKPGRPKLVKANGDQD